MEGAEGEGERTEKGEKKKLPSYPVTGQIGATKVNGVHKLDYYIIIQRLDY